MIVTTVVLTWYIWWRERDIDFRSSGDRRTVARIMCRWAERSAGAVKMGCIHVADLWTESMSLQRIMRLMISIQETIRGLFSFMQDCSITPLPLMLGLALAARNGCVIELVALAGFVEGLSA